MKSMNLFTLSEVCQNFTKEEYTSFLSVYGVGLKDKEVPDYIKFTEILNSNSGNKKIFDMFYISYNIPQIAKEFDLLRIGIQSVINIEIKNKSTEDKILKQLLRNKYYLNHFEKEVLYFTFVSSSSDLYMLSKNDNLKKVSFQTLVNKLNKQEFVEKEDIDSYFDPTRYLVSPFNSTKKFLNQEYFLTGHQESIKSTILKEINSNFKADFFAISGAAGTGKTLLVYDIILELMKEQKVLVVHCANLNSGQNKLVRKKWNIVSIKYFSKNIEQLISDNDIVVVDETQRLKTEQMTKIAEYVKKNNRKCIFAYDQRQTLSDHEKSANIEQYLLQLNREKRFNLKKKIRSNKSVANFIMSFFNLNYPTRSIDTKNSFELLYFSKDEDVGEYVSSTLEPKWKILRLTPAPYSKSSYDKNYIRYFTESHKVIGQEFDNVAVVVDKYFDYDNNGLLFYKGSSYYNAEKMLFQNMTRTRKKLMLIIVDNKRVFHEALSIIKNIS